ncbi:MAG TPA: thiosulfate oxidation carrier protein SoxY [Usitatibacter sp.]|nr:thiosulfate oxidation carrier protein SoxY [Usitatibacter sp.]
MRRRAFLAITALPLAARAQSQRFQPAQDVAPLLQKLTGGVAPERGGVEIELPQIAENGNSVPMRVKVANPMTPQDHVSAIHIVAERNPRPLVATFHLGPQSGRAEIATRVRLAGTQKVTVIAALSGNRFRMAQVDVLVTSAACLDESM